MKKSELKKLIKEAIKEDLKSDVKLDLPKDFGTLNPTLGTRLTDPYQQSDIRVSARIEAREYLSNVLKLVNQMLFNITQKKVKNALKNKEDIEMLVYLVYAMIKNEKL